MLPGAWRVGQAEQKRKTSQFYTQNILSLMSHQRFSPYSHLFFSHILPVDGGEELVAHHFFGIIWSASKPVKEKTKTLSLSPTHRHTQNVKILPLEVHNKHLWCVLPLTCIYQFLYKFSLHFLTTYRCVLVSLRAELNVLIIAVVRLLPETLGLGQNNNQLRACVAIILYQN